MLMYLEPGYSLPAGSRWKVYHGRAFFLKLVKASAARRKVRGIFYHGKEVSGTGLTGVLLTPTLIKTQRILMEKSILVITSSNPP